MLNGWHIGDFFDQTKQKHVDLKLLPLPYHPVLVFSCGCLGLWGRQHHINENISRKIMF